MKSYSATTEAHDVSCRAWCIGQGDAGQRTEDFRCDAEALSMLFCNGVKMYC